MRQKRRGGRQGVRKELGRFVRGDRMYCSGDRWSEARRVSQMMVVGLWEGGDGCRGVSELMIAW